MNEFNKETSNQTSFEQLDHRNLTIHVMIDGIEFERSLTDDLAVQEDQINVWLKRQPTVVAYWSAWLGRAEIARDALKHQFKTVEAEAYEEERNNIYNEYKKEYSDYYSAEKQVQTVNPKPKEPTADVYKYAIYRNPRFQDAFRRYLRSEEVVKYLSAAVSALIEMRSTLISLSANMRAEIESYRNKFGRSNGDYSDQRADFQNQINNIHDQVLQSFANNVNNEKIGKIPVPNSEWVPPQKPETIVRPNPPPRYSVPNFSPTPPIPTNPLPTTNHGNGILPPVLDIRNLPPNNRPQDFRDKDDDCPF